MSEHPMQDAINTALDPRNAAGVRVRHMAGRPPENDAKHVGHVPDSPECWDRCGDPALSPASTPEEGS